MSDSSQVPHSETRFQDLGLNQTMLEALEKVGYSIATPIQARAIPHLLEGKDVLGQAQTGTGKTGAFAIPLLQRIDLSLKQPQVLVLAPTRELAMQVAEAFERYASATPGLRVTAIYGGQDYSVQLRQLKRGIHVVVGTPGRVMDHMRRGSLNLDNLQGLVLDEADEMLKMGFAEDVEWVLTQAPEQRQIALFSATMPDAIRRIAQRHLRSPVEITIQQKTATAETIDQRFIVVTPHSKEDVLARVLEAEPTDGVIIFVKTKSTTEPLAEFLASHGHRTAALSGDVVQKSRERIIDNLKNGKLDVIIATDVAARGLDVQRVSHVINYDLPFDSESYVHRIGRTGRAGRAGCAILLIQSREQYKLRRIEQATRQKIQQMQIPSKRDINRNRTARFHEKITSSLANPELVNFSNVIEQYKTQNPEIAIEQIAAALAVMASGESPLFITDDLKSASFSDNQRDGRRDGRERRERSFDGGDFRSDRPRRDRDDRQSFEGRKERSHRNDADMETFRIEVGHQHQVKPGNIVGAIANETGLETAYIGRIQIYDDFSTVDLAAGMPDDILFALKKVHVSGQPLNISRADRNALPPPPERSFGRKPEKRFNKGKKFSGR
ncbi:DEAD/DEAH box helicase [Planctomicrobium sp. SH668]|uniref:DEAD/DEAH box helicase n=1 Tax=Planctomicrobium sp. SH668 TaxID=3448126 RepID=UPI003F5C218E